MRLPSAERQRQVLTTVGSLILHSALFGALALRAHLSPEEVLLSPVRLSGQTFDVDALGQAAEEEADARASGEAQPPSATPPEVPEAPEPAVTPPRPQVSPEPESEKEEPEQVVPAGEKPPTPSPPKTADPPAAQPEAKPPSPRPAVDPFDLALPGQPSTTGSAPTQPTSGAYGQKDVATGTMDLYPAFLRTIPLAAKSDPTWLSLPVGTRDSIDIVVTVDEGGSLLPIEVIETPTQKPPSYLRRAVTLNRNFLLQGRFALSRGQRSGSQTLRLTATIQKRDPDPAAPNSTGVRAFGLEGDPPSGVYFTYFSGHHVKIEMKRLD